MYAVAFAPTVNVVRPVVNAEFVARSTWNPVSLLDLSVHFRLTVGAVTLNTDAEASRLAGAIGADAPMLLEAADARPVPIAFVAFTVNV